MAKRAHVLINKALKVDQALAQSEALDSLALWTFAAGAESSHLPSALIRFFKDLRQTPAHPHKTQVCHALGAQIAQLSRSFAPTFVCRALASWETRPDPEAPLHQLAQDVASLLGASVIAPARRTSPRPTMSLQTHLSGGESLARRIRFASQDLVFEPSPQLCSARVLVLDDIRCLGATEALFAWMLQELGGASAVMAANLGQMEGLPSGGCIVTNAPLEKLVESGDGFFKPCWLSGNGRLHTRPDCQRAPGSLQPWWSGLAGHPNPWCSTCGPLASRTPWLQSVLGRWR